jgi:hypothetical protein
MRKLLAFCVPGLCLAAAGCGPFVNATRTLVIEPLQFCERGDKAAELIHDRRLADDSWKQLKSTGLVTEFSADYERGFKDGYTDYLFAGGNGQPPPVPPRDYWGVRNKTPEGQQAAEDWFAGYRHGAAAAMDSGLRPLMIVPASVPPPPPGPPGPVPAAEQAPPPSEEVPQLPPPRPLMPPANGEPAKETKAPPAGPPVPVAPLSGQ